MIINDNAFQVIGFRERFPYQHAVSRQILGEEPRNERKCRFLAANVDRQRFQPMVRLGEYFIVELEHQVRYDARGDENRKHHSIQANTACLHRRDLAAGRKSAERHKRGNEDRHRHGENNNPREVQHHQLENDGARQSFAGELIHELHHKLQNEEEHQNKERADEWCDVRFEDVPKDDHGRIY